VRTWDLATGAPVSRPVRGHRGEVLAVAVTEPDDRPVIISGGQDTTVRVWDVADRSAIGEPLRHGANVRSVRPRPTLRTPDHRLRR
jgi:WD40 repeat protein